MRSISPASARVAGGAPAAAAEPDGPALLRLDAPHDPERVVADELDRGVGARLHRAREDVLAHGRIGAGDAHAHPDLVGLAAHQHDVVAALRLEEIVDVLALDGQALPRAVDVGEETIQRDRDVVLERPHA